MDFKKLYIMKGTQISRNYKLDELITSPNEILELAKNGVKSIYWRDRPYPIAFIINLPLSLIKINIDFETLWTIKKVDKGEIQDDFLVQYILKKIGLFFKLYEFRKDIKEIKNNINEYKKLYLQRKI